MCFFCSCTSVLSPWRAMFLVARVVAEQLPLLRPGLQNWPALVLVLSGTPRVAVWWTATTPPHVVACLRWSFLCTPIDVWPSSNLDFRSLLFQGRRDTKISNFLKVEMANLDFRSLLFQGRRDTDFPGAHFLLMFTKQHFCWQSQWKVVHYFYK